MALPKELEQGDGTGDREESLLVPPGPNKERKEVSAAGQDGRR